MTNLESHPQIVVIPGSPAKPGLSQISKPQVSVGMTTLMETKSIEDHPYEANADLNDRAEAVTLPQISGHKGGADVYAAGRNDTTRHAHSYSNVARAIPGKL